MQTEEVTNLDLLVRPAIHAQGFHFRYVRPELAMQGGASHAQEDAELQSDQSLLDLVFEICQWE